MTNAQTAAKIAHDQHFNPLHPWMNGCDTLQIDPGEELKEDNATLPGGAYLIAAKRYSSHAEDRHLWVVLCACQNGASVDYVTWRMNDGRNGDQPSCYIRHDYTSIEEALSGFHARNA